MQSSTAAFLLALSSAACILPGGPVDDHPTCAAVGVGTKVDLWTSIAVKYDGAPQHVMRCTATIAPGVRTELPAEAQLTCTSSAYDFTVIAHLPDFRSARAGDTVSAVGGLTSSASIGVAGTATSDTANVTVESQSASSIGNDVSSNYVLHGTLHLHVSPLTFVSTKRLDGGAQVQDHRIEVEQFSLDVPFVWDQASFVADSSRCPE